MEFMSYIQSGQVNINSYKNHIIVFNNKGTYTYKYMQTVNNIEIYQPDYRYGFKSTVGIVREKEQNNAILEGQFLSNIEVISFKKVDTYRTIFGVNKQILLFDRGADFRLQLMVDYLKKQTKSI
jgi:hypothetical protein